MDRWTKAELDFVLEQVAQAERDGIPLKQRFEELEGKPEVGGRRARAIAQKYYNHLRAQRTKESPKEKDTTQEIQKPTAIRRLTPDMPKAKRSKVTADELVGLEYDWDVLEAFEGLPDYIADLQKELNELKKRMEERPKFDFVSFVTELVAMSDRLRRVQELERALALQEKQIDQLQRQVADYEGKFQAIRQEYEDACGWFEVFMNSSSVKQMMSMGEVKQNMKTTLDKWGNVLKIEFEEVPADKLSAEDSLG
ncbi:MAG: hypothetical protein ACOYD6_06860 [Limnochordia bacterium]|jgi:predicted  nucleic acid-binding Zn-ribbon protein